TGRGCMPPRAHERARSGRFRGSILPVPGRIASDPRSRDRARVAGPRSHGGPRASRGAPPIAAWSKNSPPRSPLDPAGRARGSGHTRATSPPSSATVPTPRTGYQGAASVEVWRRQTARGPVRGPVRLVRTRAVDGPAAPDRSVEAGPDLVEPSPQPPPQDP